MHINLSRDTTELLMVDGQTAFCLYIVDNMLVAKYPDIRGAHNYIVWLNLLYDKVGNHGSANSSFLCSKFMSVIYINVHFITTCQHFNCN